MITSKDSAMEQHHNPSADYVMQFDTPSREDEVRVYRSIEAGSSMKILSVCRKRAPVAPSITRWSQDIVTVMIVAETIFPSRATARSSPAPTARIALCGGLMMAVNSLIPNMPRLEMEKAPPSYSCGFSFFALARSASDF